MSFSETKKQQVRHYLLEKIGEEQASVVKKTAEAFDTTQATVYKYLGELEQQGIVEKLGRGKYRLRSQVWSYELSRGKEELLEEQLLYDRFLAPRIKELPENVQEIWSYLFSEMMNNVIDHSQAEQVLLLIQQNWLNTRVFLLDRGVGIFQKLKDDLGLNSLEEAVGELFKGKVTTDRENHSGEGIFFSSRIADEFMIFSSDLVFSHQRFGEDRLAALEQEDGLRVSSGTLVYMSVSNHTKKRTIDVFNAFADVDGGFTSTRIPMKHFFDRSPVSRSQAKRLCAGLEKFRRVELDFSGMEWMGQGFAHQLFAVFHRAHPEVELVPTHMAPEVEKMYRHVTG